MADNVIPFRRSPEEVLLGLPPCPVQHCARCGLREGWRWCSRDLGCSSCADLDTVFMAYVEARQTAERLEKELAAQRQSAGEKR